MAPSLLHADASPPHRSEHLPPADLRGVHVATADALVPAEQILVGSKPAHRLLAAEPPRAHAQIAEVLERVAPVNELPVEHGSDAGLPDHQGPQAKIAVKPDEALRLGAIALQPRQSE